MTYDEPMPWMSEEPEHEPEPPRRSRTEAILNGLVLFAVLPVILIALLIDLFSADRELWAELRSAWRGEEKL